MLRYCVEREDELRPGAIEAPRRVLVDDDRSPER